MYAKFHLMFLYVLLEAQTLSLFFSFSHVSYRFNWFELPRTIIKKIWFLIFIQISVCQFFFS